MNAVTLFEEKFIATNEVISTVVNASRPVRLEINGRSWTPHSLSGGGDSGQIVSQYSSCESKNNGQIIHITEGGRAIGALNPDNSVTEEGPIMYDGMSAVLSASVPLEDLILNLNPSPIPPPKNPNPDPN